MIYQIIHLTQILKIGTKEYGKQRLYATVGFLTANFIIEKLNTLPDKSKGTCADFNSMKGYNFFICLSITLFLLYVIIYLLDLPI